jgi:acetyl-CoA carboxylase carboxyltransferase component
MHRAGNASTSFPFPQQGNQALSDVRICFRANFLSRQMPQEQFANPYVAAERGYVDAVIQPKGTRRRMIPADGNRYKKFAHAT